MNSSEVFCSLFNSTDDESCSAALGSPVICRNEISGLVTNAGNCSIADDSQILLNYESVGDSSDWIEDVIYYTTVENTVRFIVHVAHFDFPDLETAVIRCAASIITNAHVLTTASCVVVQPPQAIAVQATPTSEFLRSFMNGNLG